jgi:hypothetical protein
MALVEFYEDDAEYPFASVKDGAVPRKGEYVNILKVTYRVQRVTWAVDSPTGEPQKLRANVQLSRES